MSRSVMISDLSWDEYERRLKDEGAIVLVPVGAVEQHGYHLPLGTDWMMASYMAQRAAKDVNGLVAAAVSYGYRSQIRTGGGGHRCGTISLDGETLINLVKNLLVEYAHDGAKKLAIIDGHFENRFYLDEACHLAIRDLHRDGIDNVKIVKLMYSERIHETTIEKIYKDKVFPGLDLEHAGVLETSLMLYCYPDHVDMAKIATEDLPNFPPYDIFPVDPDWVPTSGALSSGIGSSVEIGKLLTEEFVKSLGVSLNREFPS
ncbi:MAG: creatininase [Alphaproteobacteria bacterium]